MFHLTIPWGKEIARWVLIWIVFGGQAYAFVVDAHVGVEAAVRALPERRQGLLNVPQHLISIAAFLIIGSYRDRYTARSIATQQLAPGSRLALALPQSAIPVGSVLAIAGPIIKLVKDRRG
ncbi:MAG: TRAP transporter small permease [Bacillota bacterium]